MFQRQLGVLGGEFGDPALLAALRRSHFDAGAAPLLQKGAEQLGVGERPRHNHLGGDRDVTAVVLEGESPQGIGLVLALGVFEIEALAIGEPAVAQVKELDVCGVPGERNRQHVGRAQAALVGHLRLGEMADSIEPVAIARGLLVLA